MSKPRRKPNPGGGASGKRGAGRAPAPGQVGWSFDGTPKSYVVREQARPGKELREGWYCRAMLHTRTVLCDNCTGLIPLSPQWRLSLNQGIRLKPNMEYLVCDYEVVAKADESAPTVQNAIAVCPFCGTTTPKGYLGLEARGGHTVADVARLNSAGLWGGQVVHKPKDAPADMAYGRMGDVEYCHVMHYDWIIYRQGQTPMQGKSQLLFLVPGAAMMDSVRQRYRMMVAKGVYRPEEDPMLRDLGIYGGEPSPYAPGLERLARHHGFASVDAMWEPGEEDMDPAMAAYYDPPVTNRRSAPEVT